MNLVRKISMSFVIATLLLCGNAFAKPDQAPPIVDVNVVGDETPPKTQPVNACADLTVGSGSDQPIYVVPDDQRLVIEYISIDPDGFLDAGDYVQVTVKTVVDKVEGTFLAGTADGDTFAGAKGGRMVRIHADPGSDVVGGVGTLNVSGDTTVCFSGELSPDS